MTIRRFKVWTLAVVAAVGTVDAVGERTSPTVHDYLRCFVHQDFVDSNGRLLSAPVIADAAANGLASLALVDPDKAELVRGVLEADRELHRLEYVVRTRMSEGARTVRNITDRRAIQEVLWSHFWGDDRWVRRVLMALQAADTRKLFGPPSQWGLPQKRERVATADDVRAIIKLLATYNPRTNSACGQNPYIVFEYAVDADSMLLADVYSILGSSPVDDEAALRTTLTGLLQRGWMITRAPAAQ